jgi:hypothetical protein
MAPGAGSRLVGRLEDRAPSNADVRRDEAELTFGSGVRTVTTVTTVRAPPLTAR